MAVLKIYESQIAPKSPNVPQTGALTIPVGLATQYGQALSSVGKVVEKIQLENKAEEDANEASDLITIANQKIAEKYNELLQSREEKFVPYPQKWLKNEGWKEEITYEKPKNTMALQFSDRTEKSEGIHEEDIQEYLEKARKENNTEMVAIYEKELRRMRND